MGEGHLRMQIFFGCIIGLKSGLTEFDHKIVCYKTSIIVGRLYCSVIKSSPRITSIAQIELIEYIPTIIIQVNYTNRNTESNYHCN